MALNGQEVVTSVGLLTNSYTGRPTNCIKYAYKPC